MRSDIALIDARLGEVLGRVDTGESGRAWMALGKLLDAYDKAKDGAEQAEVLASIRATVKAAQARGCSMAARLATIGTRE